MLSLIFMLFNLIETTYITYTFAANPTRYNGTILFLYYHVSVFGYLWTLYVAMIMTVDQWLPVVTPFMRLSYETTLATRMGRKAQVMVQMVIKNPVFVNYLYTIKLYGDLAINQLNWMFQSRLRQHSVIISDMLQKWGLTKIEISQLKELLNNP